VHHQSDLLWFKGFGREELYMDSLLHIDAWTMDASDGKNSHPFWTGELKKRLDTATLFVSNVYTLL
jgi:ribosomal protein L31